jgi:hypothetical protein
MIQAPSPLFITTKLFQQAHSDAIKQTKYNWFVLLSKLKKKVLSEANIVECFRITQHCRDYKAYETP